MALLLDVNQFGTDLCKETWACRGSVGVRDWEDRRYIESSSREEGERYAAREERLPFKRNSRQRVSSALVACPSP